MSSPLSVVPGGIGTGEAQIARTPLTDKSIFFQQQVAAKKNQEQKLKEAEDLAKMNFEGIHRKDAEKIMDDYSGIVDLYGKYKYARTAKERALNKIEYDKAKAEFDLKLANSKDYNKQLYTIGNVLLGANDGDYDEEQKSYFNKLKDSPSFGQQIDLNKFNKKAKPLDVLDINKKIIEASKIDKSTEFGQQKIAGKDVIVTTNGEALYKPLFFDNLSAVIQQNPRYAQEVLIPKYKDSYIKAGGDINDGQKLTEYIFNQEFESKRPAVDVTKRTASQVGDGFNINYGFSGGSGQSKYVPEFGYDSTGDLTFDVSSKTPTGERMTTTQGVPVGQQIGVNVDYNTSKANGLFDMSNGGKFTKDPEIISVKSSRVIEVPVVYNSKTGDPSLANSYGESRYKNADGKEVVRKTQLKYNKKPTLIKVIEIEDTDGNTYLQPLDQIIADKIQKADQNAFKTIATWGGGSSTKPSGEVTDVSSTFKKPKK